MEALASRRGRKPETFGLPRQKNPESESSSSATTPVALTAGDSFGNIRVRELSLSLRDVAFGPDGTRSRVYLHLARAFPPHSDQQKAECFCLTPSARGLRRSYFSAGRGIAGPSMERPHETRPRQIRGRKAAGAASFAGWAYSFSPACPAAGTSGSTRRPLSPAVPVPDESHQHVDRLDDEAQEGNTANSAERLRTPAAAGNLLVGGGVESRCRRSTSNGSPDTETRIAKDQFRGNTVTAWPSASRSSARPARHPSSPKPPACLRYCSNLPRQDHLGEPS